MRSLFPQCINIPQCHHFVTVPYTRILKISLKNLKGFRNVRKSKEASGYISVHWPIAFLWGSEVLNPLQSGPEFTPCDYTEDKGQFIYTVQSSKGGILWTVDCSRIEGDRCQFIDWHSYPNQMSWLARLITKPSFHLLWSTVPFLSVLLIECVCVCLQKAKDGFAQSRVQKLASFELWAATDLKVTDVSPKAEEYTHTSFYRALHSHACTWMHMYAYTVYVGPSSKAGA